ncbi:MAG: transketolase C-terminal domain-containing protein [Alphaproteobacteria bacterium]
MARTVAETIRDLTRDHIADNDGLVIGQCLTAVGWVQNTIPPQHEGIVELPMTDISGAGIAVGAAIMGRRPILVLRFQSFLWLNISPLVNYAAKSKEIFGYPAPVFTRAIASEADASGPLHTNCFHHLAMHMPGIKVCAPMTPKEYEEIWADYINGDDPFLVSEHRRSYLSSDELPDQIEEGAEITLYAVSAGRFNLPEAADRLREKGIKCNIVNILWLKPFVLDDRVLEPLKQSGAGIVVDSAFEIAGASQSFSYELMLASGKPVKALAQFDRSPGVAKHLENGTPSVERIVETAIAMVQEARGD